MTMKVQTLVNQRSKVVMTIKLSEMRTDLNEMKTQQI